MFMDTAQDDCILGNLRFVSKDKDTQVYGALIHAVMTNPMIRDSAAYQTYFAFATGEATPKPKRIYKKTDSPIIKTTTKSSKESPSKRNTAPTKKNVSSKKPLRKQCIGVQIRDTSGVSVSKKKAPVTTDKGKASSSSEGDDFESKGDSRDDEESDDVSDGDGNDDDSDNDDGDNDSDDLRIESDDDKNDDDQEEEYVHTPENYEFIDDEEEYEELYKDINVRKLLQLKQSDHSTQHLEAIKSQILTIVDDHLAIRLGDSIQKAFQSYTAKFKKNVQDEKKRHIDLIEKLVKAIINDEVKTQLPQILPKAVSDFATHVITSIVNESIENIILAKSSSQPQSTYEAAMSLTELELKKILLDKMQKSQSYQGAKEHKELYDGLAKSYKLTRT
nr:hypothetical protein [Tanacetum cinerariifolium]